jgi:hypothetical protein
MKLLIMQFSPIPRHFVSPRTKYSPQHPVLKHPQSTLLPLVSQTFHTHTVSYTNFPIHYCYCMPSNFLNV